MQTHKHVCKNTCPHACTGHTRTCVRTCIPKPASPSSHPRSHRPLAGASDVSSASASCRPQANGSPGRPAPAPQGRPSCGSPGAGAAAACPRPGGPENLAARSCGGPQYGLLCLSGVCPRTSDCTPCASVSLCRGGITGLLWVLPMASPPPSRCWEGLPSRRGTPWPRRGRRPEGVLAQREVPPTASTPPPRPCCPAARYGPACACGGSCLPRGFTAVRKGSRCTGPTPEAVPREPPWALAGPTAHLRSWGCSRPCTRGT